MSILQIALPVPLFGLFDYRYDPDITPVRIGCRVRVSFGRRMLVGVVLKIQSQSTLAPDKIKSIEEIIDAEPLLEAAQLHLMTWASQYYHHPIGEVIFSSMPKSYKEGKHPKEPLPRAAFQSTAVYHTLNPEQKSASKWMQKQTTFSCTLLEGVTGSGKTEIYLQLIKERLEQGQKALVLIPEIALSPQMVDRFEYHFGSQVVSFHSKMTEQKRREAWILAKKEEPIVIVGTRSSLFLPIRSLGLIIVDEEHEPCYKQTEGFRYHARDCSIFLAKYLDIPILLGSATPSLATLHNVDQKRYAHFILTHRAGGSTLPTISCIDCRASKISNGLSIPLQKAMKEHLAANHQVLLFLNRRGYAPTLLCRECQWMAECPRCHARYTLHQNINRLWCHHCDKQTPTPTRCESCQSTDICAVGLGTERLEESLQEQFKETSIIRVDSDTTRLKGSLQTKLDEIHLGAPAILLGTQMLAKGHHFSNVSLVAIVDVDSGLLSADYYATERMGQLIIQVAGRAGRESTKGQVLLQTTYPEHPLLQPLLKHNYPTFAKQLLAERQEAALPPFTKMAIIRAEAHNVALCTQFLASAHLPKEWEGNIIGPLPAPLSKKAGLYRMQLLIFAPQRSALQHFINHISTQLEAHSDLKKIRWAIDVDPIDMQ
jgi:primosomal protein N' (replication factor Y) (superfamily II helicase)